MTNQEIAQNWRDQARRPEHIKHGYVVIHNGTVTGWISTLYSPSDWVAGCVAVGTNGHEWVAVGGTEIDGAEKWERV